MTVVSVAPDPDSADTVAEVRGWVTRAAATPWPALQRELAEAEGAWALVTEGLSQAEVEGGPRDGDWTIADVVAHVASDLHGFAEGLEALAAGQAVGESVFAPRWPGERDIEALRSRWESGWAAVRRAGDRAAGSAVVGSSRFAHDILGPLTARELVGLALWHADDHGGQLRRMRGSTATG